MAYLRDTGSSSSIKTLQVRLDRYWNLGTPDGIWGPKSISAATSFVRRYHPDLVDSVPGLEAGHEQHAAFVNTLLGRIQETMAKQEILRAETLYDGAVDGVPGLMTTTGYDALRSRLQGKGVTGADDMPDDIRKIKSETLGALVRQPVAARVAAEERVVSRRVESPVVAAGDAPHMLGDRKDKGYSIADARTFQPDVLRAQAMLQAIRAHGDVEDIPDIGPLDGRFGGKTEAGILAYQKGTTGLEPTGALDPATWQSIHTRFGALDEKVRTQTLDEIERLTGSEALKGLSPSERLARANAIVAREFGLDDKQQLSLGNMPATDRWYHATKSHLIVSDIDAANGGTVTGDASIYGSGDGFHRGKTSSGPIFDRNEYTFAINRRHHTHANSTRDFKYGGVYEVSPGVWGLATDTGGFGAARYGHRSFDFSLGLANATGNKTGAYHDGDATITASFDPKMTMAYWRRQELMGFRVPAGVKEDMDRYLRENKPDRRASVDTDPGLRLQVAGVQAKEVTGSLTTRVVSADTAVNGDDVAGIQLAMLQDQKRRQERDADLATA